MKLSYKILLLIVFQSTIGFSQTDDLNSLFNEFKVQVSNYEKSYGYVYLDDENQITYYSLILNSTIDELIEYTNDTSPAIRCLMYSGLVGRNANDSILTKIINSHINDTAQILFKGGSIYTKWTVIEYMSSGYSQKNNSNYKPVDYNARIEKIKNQQETDIIGLNKEMLSKDVLLQIDSLVLKNKNIEIVSFNISINGKIINSLNNSITDEMKNSIKNLSSGDKIYFENIKAKGVDNKFRYLGVIMIKIE